MAFNKPREVNFRRVLLILVLLTITVTATTNIDCNGKAFHCVNSTHFKICVDFGGISKTVDDFLIPCPRSTVCTNNNYFECEYQTTTTSATVSIQSDVTNELIEQTVTSPWDLFDVTTLIPTVNNVRRIELSENNHQTIASELNAEVAVIQAEDIVKTPVNIILNEVITDSHNILPNNTFGNLSENNNFKLEELKQENVITFSPTIYVTNDEYSSKKSASIALTTEKYTGTPNNISINSFKPETTASYHNVNPNNVDVITTSITNHEEFDFTITVNATSKGAEKELISNQNIGLASLETNEPLQVTENIVKSSSVIIDLTVTASSNIVTTQQKMNDHTATTEMLPTNVNKLYTNLSKTNSVDTEQNYFVHDKTITNKNITEKVLPRQQSDSKAIENTYNDELPSTTAVSDVSAYSKNTTINEKIAPNSASDLFGVNITSDYNISSTQQDSKIPSNFNKDTEKSLLISENDPNIIRIDETSSRLPNLDYTMHTNEVHSTTAINNGLNNTMVEFSIKENNDSTSPMTSESYSLTENTVVNTSSDPFDLTITSDSYLSNVQQDTKMINVIFSLSSIKNLNETYTNITEENFKIETHNFSNHENSTSNSKIVDMLAHHPATENILVEPSANILNSTPLIDVHDSVQESPIHKYNTGDNTTDSILKSTVYRNFPKSDNLTELSINIHDSVTIPGIHIVNTEQTIKTTYPSTTPASYYNALSSKTATEEALINTVDELVENKNDIYKNNKRDLIRNITESLPNLVESGIITSSIRSKPLFTENIVYDYNITTDSYVAYMETSTTLSENDILTTSQAITERQSKSTTQAASKSNLRDLGSSSHTVGVYSNDSFWKTGGIESNTNTENSVGWIENYTNKSYLPENNATESLIPESMKLNKTRIINKVSVREADMTNYYSNTHDPTTDKTTYINNEFAVPIESKQNVLNSPSTKFAHLVSTSDIFRVLTEQYNNLFVTEPLPSLRTQLNKTVSKLHVKDSLVDTKRTTPFASENTILNDSKLINFTNSDLETATSKISEQPTFRQINSSVQSDAKNVKSNNIKTILLPIVNNNTNNIFGNQSKEFSIQNSNLTPPLDLLSRINIKNKSNDIPIQIGASISKNNLSVKVQPNIDLVGLPSNISKNISSQYVLQADFNKSKEVSTTWSTQFEDIDKKSKNKKGIPLANKQTQNAALNINESMQLVTKGDINEMTTPGNLCNQNSTTSNVKYKNERQNESTNEFDNTSFTKSTNHAQQMMVLRNENNSQTNFLPLGIGKHQSSHSTKAVYMDIKDNLNEKFEDSARFSTPIISTTSLDNNVHFNKINNNLQYVKVEGQNNSYDITVNRTQKLINSLNSKDEQNLPFPLLINKIRNNTHNGTINKLKYTTYNRGENYNKKLTPKIAQVNLNNSHPLKNYGGSESKPRFMCNNRHRGKYSDKNDCKIFYICIGRQEPIFGKCPNTTVFSEISKQCTKNLSHCITNNQFQCVSNGRYIDIFSDQFYYICVKKVKGFIRFKLKCQKGYHLDRLKLQCVLDSPNGSLSNEENSTIDSKSKEIINSNNKKNYFECTKQGKFVYPDDCRKYYECTKNSKSDFRRKIKKCDSDEV